jgi:hypothetical protein
LLCWYSNLVKIIVLEKALITSPAVANPGGGWAKFSGIDTALPLI